MKRRFWKITIAMSLLASAAVGANGAESGAKKCSEAKPFREVAQDETKTIAELCLEALDTMPIPSGRGLSNRSHVAFDLKGRLPTRHASRN
jgi:hypothetical protein